MRIAAAHADEFNLTSASPASAREKFAALDAACVGSGRDPKTLRRSVMTGMLLGASADAYARGVTQFMERIGAAGDAESYMAPRRGRWLTGTPSEALPRAREFAAAGAERLLVQHFAPRDLAGLDLLAEVRDALR
jgi:alkanesulfonate monooxygenase SsuD/methylene tetrahydromethanopterin reductase-like flavin-dependent oxidoreductase (luciferase family)